MWSSADRRRMASISVVSIVSVSITSIGATSWNRRFASRSQRSVVSMPCGRQAIRTSILPFRISRQAPTTPFDLAAVENGADGRSMGRLEAALKATAYGVVALAVALVVKVVYDVLGVFVDWYGIRASQRGQEGISKSILPLLKKLINTPKAGLHVHLGMSLLFQSQTLSANITAWLNAGNPNTSDC